MNDGRKKILYVDDDQASLAMMERWISTNESSFDVTVVDSIEAALDAVGRCSFDLFIFDYCLAGGTGIGLCREIRALGSTKPVIMFSAMGRQVDFDSAKRAGANDYLIKPDDLDLVVPTIRRLLDLRPKLLADKIRPRAARAIL